VGQGLEAGRGGAIATRYSLRPAGRASQRRRVRQAIGQSGRSNAPRSGRLHARASDRAGVLEQQLQLAVGGLGGGVVAAADEGAADEHARHAGEGGVGGDGVGGRARVGRAAAAGCAPACCSGPQRAVPIRCAAPASRRSPSPPPAAAGDLQQRVLNGVAVAALVELRAAGWHQHGRGESARGQPGGRGAGPAAARPRRHPKPAPCATTGCRPPQPPLRTSTTSKF
jgi:hypothetical protein